MISTKPGNNILWATRTAIAVFSLLAVSTLHAQFLPIEKVRHDFIALLQRPSVAANPSFQSFTTDSVLVEKGFFYSEATEKVPVLIYKPVASDTKKLPVVICLHGTGGSTEGMKNLLYRFSRSGFMAVAIDGRYHGERVKAMAGKNYYVTLLLLPGKIKTVPYNNILFSLIPFMTCGNWWII